MLLRRYFRLNKCNSEFLESKRREPKFVDFGSQKFQTVFKHLKTYSVLCRILSKFDSSKHKSGF